MYAFLTRLLFCFVLGAETVFLLFSVFFFNFFAYHVVTRFYFVEPPLQCVSFSLPREHCLRVGTRALLGRLRDSEAHLREENRSCPATDTYLFSTGVWRRSSPGA